MAIKSFSPAITQTSQASDSQAFKCRSLLFPI
jgi:hypothetical protein